MFCYQVEQEDLWLTMTIIQPWSTSKKIRYYISFSSNTIDLDFACKLVNLKSGLLSEQRKNILRYLLDYLHKFVSEHNSELSPFVSSPQDHRTLKLVTFQAYVERVRPNLTMALIVHFQWRFQSLIQSYRSLSLTSLVYYFY